MNVNATLINLYHVCKRECWLHANGIRMEHTSDIVYDGKLLHESSYPQRAVKHLEMELSARFGETELTGKIDFYDGYQKVIHETKRSDKVEQAHQWQVKFYLWLLKLNGIENATAVLEYPKLRQTDTLHLTLEDEQYLQTLVQKIPVLVSESACPARINAKICKSCSYYELCYIDE